MLLCFCSCVTGDAVDLAVLIAGVAGAFILLTLLSLTAGVAMGVVLGRRVQKRKGEPPERKQLSSGSFEKGWTAEEEYDIVDHIYDVVGDQSSTDSCATLYQGLDVRSHDYTYVYNQMRGGACQGLDLQGREEHHY